MRKLMWKTLLVLWIPLLSLPATAQEDFKCGSYEIKGVLRKYEGQNVIKLYEGSLSETILTLAPDLQELASINLDNPVLLKGRMYQPVSKYRGHVESMLSSAEVKALTAAEKPYTERFMRDDIKERVPDPIHPDMDSGIKLIAAGPCSEKLKKK